MRFRRGQRIALAAAVEETRAGIRITAYTGAPIRLGGFGRAVIDLAGMTVPERRLPILRDHDPGRIVGGSTRIQKTTSRLVVEANLSQSTRDGREIAQLLDEDVVDLQSSIGARVDSVDDIREGETLRVNGRTVEGPLVHLEATTLNEVSVLSLGADSNTRVEKLRAGNVVQLDCRGMVRTGETYQELVARYERQGMSNWQARREVALKHPDAHRRFVAAANGGRLPPSLRRR